MAINYLDVICDMNWARCETARNHKIQNFLCNQSQLIKLGSDSLYISSGNSAVQAISLLISKGVPEPNIIFLNLISVSLHSVSKILYRRAGFLFLILLKMSLSSSPLGTSRRTCGV